MALPNGVRVDDEGNVVFEGRSGQTLLLSVLLRAKFSKPFEPVTFLNEWMAELIAGLNARFRAGLPLQPSQPTSFPQFGDDPATRLDIAEAIVGDANSLGWWSWSVERRTDFIRNVACVPHPISDTTVEEILLAIEDRVAYARRLVSDVDGAAS
jgi:hypothetical protein